MDLIFAYLAGLLTLINPCVLPVLPVTLLAALNTSRYGPMALAAGMGVTFVIIGMTIAAIGPAIGLDDLLMSKIASVFMIGFGMILIIPQFSAAFASATGGSANAASMQLHAMENANENSGVTSGLKGQFIIGALLGAVWGPCVGPTLGGAISLASQGQNMLWAASIMSAFAGGIATIILGLSYGAREAIIKRQATLRSFAEKARPITGGVLVLLGLIIFFKLHHIAEIWLLDNLPVWLLDFSVKY